MRSIIASVVLTVTVVGCARFDGSTRATPTSVFVPTNDDPQLERALFTAAELGTDWTKLDLANLYREDTPTLCGRSWPLYRDVLVVFNNYEVGGQIGQTIARTSGRSVADQVQRDIGHCSSKDGVSLLDYPEYGDSSAAIRVISEQSDYAGANQVEETIFVQVGDVVGTVSWKRLFPETATPFPLEGERLDYLLRLAALLESKLRIIVRSRT